MWFQCSALKQSNYRLCLSWDFQLISLPIILGFPGGSEGKQSACNAGDLGLITWVGTIPWRRKWQSTPVFVPGESRGQRSLAGYSPQRLKESDTTEKLSTHAQLVRTYCVGNYTQYSIITYMGEESKKELIYVSYNWFTLLYTWN